VAQTKQQKSVVRRWVKALESGEYKQGASALVAVGRTHDYFCCLGVLCDMAVRAKVIAMPNANEQGNSLSYLGRTSYPPDVVRKWVGIKNRGAERVVAAMNDDGVSFKQIAKYIKAHADELFV
jgi:hypothetical protein